MTYEVHIVPGQDFMRREISLAIFDQQRDGILYILPGNNNFYQQNAHDLATDVDVFWHIPVDALHPLLAALSRHLGAVEHPEQLRADYMAERQRVDKLIDAAIGRAS